MQNSFDELLSVNIEDIQKTGKKKGRKRVVILSCSLVVVVALTIVTTITINKSNDYSEAISLLENAEYDSAYESFIALGNYNNSAEMAKESLYQKAQVQLENKLFDKALESFTALGEYKDSKEIVADIPYQKACYFMENNKLSDAIQLFEELGDYKDCKEKLSVAQQHLSQKQSEKHDESNLGLSEGKEVTTVVENPHPSSGEPLSLNISSCYLKEGESIQLTASGYEADTVTWSVNPTGLKISDTGYVTNNDSFERYKVTATTKSGATAQCIIMGKSSDNMSKYTSNGYVYQKYTMIYTIENVTDGMGLSTYYDGSELKEEFGDLFDWETSVSYHYIVTDLATGEKIAKKYAEYLFQKGCENYCVTPADAYGVKMNDYSMEIHSGGKRYKITISTSFACLGRPVETSIPMIDVDIHEYIN